VQVAHDPEITRDGIDVPSHGAACSVLPRWSVVEPRVQAGRGNEKDFASEADSVGKVHNLATHAIPRAQADAIVNWILGRRSRRRPACLRGCCAGVTASRSRAQVSATDWLARTLSRSFDQTA
jgi:hypothetical protein